MRSSSWTVSAPQPVSWNRCSRWQVGLAPHFPEHCVTSKGFPIEPEGKVSKHFCPLQKHIAASYKTSFLRGLSMQTSFASSSPQMSPMSRIFSIKKNNKPGLVAINIHSLQQLHTQGTLFHPPQLSEQSYFLPHKSQLQPLPSWSPGCCGDLWNAWPSSHGNKISRAQ